LIWFVFVFDCDKTDDIEKDKEIYRIDGCCNIFFFGWIIGNSRQQREG